MWIATSENDGLMAWTVDVIISVSEIRDVIQVVTHKVENVLPVALETGCTIRHDTPALSRSD